MTYIPGTHIDLSGLNEKPRERNEAELVRLYEPGTKIMFTNLVPKQLIKITDNLLVLNTASAL